MNRTLIVSESEELYSDIKIVLDKLGFKKNETASSLHTVYEILNKANMSLIIIDSSLESKIVFDVISKAKEKNAQTKILVISDVRETKSNDAFLDEGASELFYKPFNPIEFYSVLSKLIKSPVSEDRPF
jgi:DNA-binding response OmpR family regulator